MVEEELSKVEKEKARKKRIFHYDTEDHIDDEHLASLSKGIIKDDCEGSPVHDEDGRFASWDTDGSWALPKRAHCKEKGGQYKRKKTSKGANKEPCGRKDRSNICKEEKLNSTTADAYLSKRIEMIVRDTITKELRRQAKKHGCSMQDALKIMNTIELAQKGDLNKKPK